MKFDGRIATEESDTGSLTKQIEEEIERKKT